MRHSKAMGVFIAVFAALNMAACGGGNTSSTGTGGGTESASVFTIGTDAPLPSVVSCPVTIMGITLYNGTTNVPVLGTSQPVDFAKLSGLHQIVDLQPVPAGTYSSATVTLSSATIDYLDTSTTPPTIVDKNATFTMQSDTVTFSSPVTVQSGETVGLRMEFDLAKSIQVDNTGNITGMIDPTFNMQLLNASNAEVSIDDFHVGWLSSASPTLFTVQGPLGRDWTVQTASSTVFDDPSVSVSSYNTNTILSVSGTIDPVTHYIDATEVQVVSTDKFYMGGLFSYINPATGPATTADLYIREELPAETVPNIQEGEIGSFTLNGSEVYRIGNIALPLTSLLFNNSSLTPGQNVDIGGKINTSNGNTTLTVHRVVLRRQGQEGTLTANSVTIQSGNVGTFTFTDNYTAGVLLPSPLAVMTTNQTSFIGVSGLSGLSTAGAVPLRIVGYVLIDPQTNAPVLIANSVEELTPNS
jgi:Domain of unknown function (DUF4382)